jgi:hypothetical protein
LLLKLANAFANTKVLLGAIFANNEEASSLGIVGMLTNFEAIKISELGFSLVVELEELLDEVRIVASKFLTILLEVKDSTGLALYLVDIGVVNSGNLIAGTGTFTSFIVSITLSLLSSDLLLLLNVTELWLNAELVMTTLLLPEGLQFLPCGLGETKISILNLKSGL